MSYILDALRKADAERDRGSVPGIHAQPNFGALPASGTPDPQRPWLWLVAGALAMTLLGALGWWFIGGGAPRDPAVAGTVSPAPATSAAAPVAGSVTIPAPAPASSPTATPPLSPARPKPIADAAAPPAVVGAAASTARRPRPVPVPPAAAGASDAAIAAAVKPATPVPAAAAQATASATAAAAALSAAADRVYALAELPEEIRRQLPPVYIGGSMYSTAAANRVLIINGQVLHEGDKIGPELVLQQIRMRSAVLAFRGYRYTITF